MSSDVTLSVGDVMPECPIPMRPDGTVEHMAHVLDPVRLHLVLGCDVSPYHEQAIRKACHIDDPGPDGWQHLAPATKQRQWVWFVRTNEQPACMWLHLYLRPGPISVPPQAWMVSYPVEDLCGDCARSIGQQLVATARALRVDPSKGMGSRVILVGRDQRVLSISKLACHNQVASEWALQLACQHMQSMDPEATAPHQPDQCIWHMAGEPDVLVDHGSDAWLMRHGWISAPRRARRRGGRV
jgi:hypothetical protein